MIASLADAWHWYETARHMSRTLARLGDRHWDALPWDGDLGRDDHLKELSSATILDGAQTILDDLDDLCVMLLFSVFEAEMRERVLEAVDVELPSLHHPAIIRAVAEMKEGIEHGSFFRVLESYKGIDANLVEAVNQVRRYRNWVAHGRRTDQPAAVSPPAAYERLKRFLDYVGT